VLRSLLPVLLLASAACSVASSASAPSPQPPSAQPPSEPPSEQAPSAPEPAAARATASLRVHVIGASVSGGFEDGPMTGAKEPGDTVSLHHVLKAWCGEHARASSHAAFEMMTMFTDPMTIGERQIQGVGKVKADFVVAIDFPFWFAYGHPEGDDEAAFRKGRLTKGLEMLASLDRPVVIGDLPDFSGAARRMLSPSQIPKPALRRELNDQLVAFVAKHPKLTLVPLAELVATLKDKGVELPVAGKPLPTAPKALLQGDHLHVNRLGMALLGYQMQDALRSLFPKDHALAQQRWTFEQFVEACGAEADLEAMREAAKNGAPADAKVPAGAGAGDGK
jgi:hypothetical protein